MIIFETRILSQRLWQKECAWTHDRHVRVLELAYPPKLLALHATWIVWIAFDLLLSASDASNSKSLSWFPSLCHAPVGIDDLAIDHSLAVGSIIIKITHSLSWYLSLSNKSWQELRPSPNLWSQPILSGVRITRHCTGRCWWVTWGHRGAVRCFAVGCSWV